MAQTAIANSTLAGAVSYPVVAGALTAILAIAGVVIPPFYIGALVMTQAMDISIASTVLSFVVTHYFPDSYQQKVAALAALAPKVLAMIPQSKHEETDFPEAPPQVLTPSNISNAAAAIAVIQAKTAETGGLNGT